MQKPNSLRALLTAAYPELSRDPDRLNMWVEEGRVRSPMVAARGFTWEYTLNITVVNMTADPSVLFLAINDWCRANQPDLLTPLPNSGYRFEVDLIDQQTVDLHIVLKLSEQVLVITNSDETTSLQYPGEPDMSWLIGDTPLTMPAVPLADIVPVAGTTPVNFPNPAA